MSDFFKNKVALITGGTDGIGKAMVMQLLNQGAKVATCGRSHDKLYELQSRFPSSPLHTVLADVSNENDCRILIDSTIKIFGCIDILINNAGISMRALFNEASIDAMKQVININLYGSMYCTKFALPHIIKSKGTIAGISSLTGYRGFPGRSIYSASKFALQGWLEGLRVEMMLKGVNVLWVSPGTIATNIRYKALSSDGSPIGESPMNEENMMSAEDCARKVLSAIKNKKRTLVMTSLAKKIILLNKFFPRMVDRMLKRSFFDNGKLIK